MSILVIAEHDNSSLKLATLNVVAAAKAIGGDIDVLVAGAGCGAVAEAAAKAEGVNKVLVADNAVYGHFLGENLGELVAEIGKGYTHILAAAGTTGKDFMPRVAALLDVAQISDIIRVESADTFARPIYAGNAIATVQSLDATKVITVRGTAFDAVAAEGGSAAVETLSQVEDTGLSQFVGEEMAKSDRPELTSARVVISGGRGMADSEHFQMLEKLADKLRAADGSTRAAVEAGFAPNDTQASQNGQNVEPMRYNEM